MFALAVNEENAAGGKVIYFALAVNEENAAGGEVIY
jgi:L-serine deaminase